MWHKQTTLVAQFGRVFMTGTMPQRWGKLGAPFHQRKHKAECSAWHMGSHYRAKTRLVHEGPALSGLFPRCPIPPVKNLAPRGPCSRTVMKEYRQQLTCRSGNLHTCILMPFETGLPGLKKQSNTCCVCICVHDAGRDHCGGKKKPWPKNMFAAFLGHRLHTHAGYWLCRSNLVHLAS